VARKPKIRKMRTASGFLIVAFIAFVAAGIAYLKHADISTGAELIGLGFVPLAIAFGFTLHTTCKVPTTRRTPCKNDSYGFLFGCTGNGHWLEKFFIRLGFRRNEPQQVQRRRPDSVQVFMYQSPSRTEPLKVSVETSARDICGFWVGVVSMVAAIVSVVITVTH
jgi:hypothetical protein